MGFCSEFKEFAVRGNVVDMAVGVVIGGAFGKIVTSFVNDIVMPPLGKLVGDVDFSNLYINLTDKQFANLAEAKKAGAAVIAYAAQTCRGTGSGPYLPVLQERNCGRRYPLPALHQPAGLRLSA